MSILAVVSLHRDQTLTSLIIFLRFPTPGKTKTRLAREVGDVLAAEWYRLCVEHVLAELKSGRDVEIVCAVAEDGELENVKEWLGNEFRYTVQMGRDLGERMSNAIQEEFARGAEYVIVVGSDVPEISRADIAEAMERLLEQDVVIAPSNDGGYSLIGMNRNHRELFEGIEWSTESVLEVTVENARRKELTVSLVHPLMDIDTIDDLRTWLANTSSRNELTKLSRDLVYLLDSQKVG